MLAVVVLFGQEISTCSTSGKFWDSRPSLCTCTRHLGSALGVQVRNGGVIFDFREIRQPLSSACTLIQDWN